MRQLLGLDGHDLTGLPCPWCGRTPQPATSGLKAVRDGAVVGMVGWAAAGSLGGLYPTGSVVVTQLWVRREDLGELIGSQLVQRAAGVVSGRRGVRCLVAPGTLGVPDCHHLPADWLEARGFAESVRGSQWRLDLGGAIRLPDALRWTAEAAVRLVRPERPAPANRG